jgi:threonine dehydratase
MPQGASIVNRSATEITLENIRIAERRIRDNILLSPCCHSVDLSEMTGQQVYVKLDNLQRTGAFKERGALNKILTLAEEEKRRGVITASAGNHGQAVAYHATRRGIRALVVMPVATPLVKIDATQRFGARIVLHGANYDEAYAEAMRLCEAEGLTFLHPFNDPAVICGQGSIGLEILEQVPGLEAVVVPVGGGGLISGVACAIKETNPKIRVIGVQTERLPSMLRAEEAGHPVTIPANVTIADGIAVRRAGDITLPLVERYVDELVVVDEEEIANAILVLLEKEKTLAEGAGAVALAALLNKRTTLGNQKTAVLVCGGNIDVSLLAKIIERGLIKDGRRVRIRVWLPDRPGALHGLTKILLEQQANIIETVHNRSGAGISLGDTAIDISLETRGKTHVAALAHALDQAQYKHEWIH